MISRAELGLIVAGIGLTTGTLYFNNYQGNSYNSNNFNRVKESVQKRNYILQIKKCKVVRC